MAKIAAYVRTEDSHAFEWSENILKSQGGFNPQTLKIKPFFHKTAIAGDCEEMLWNVTEAVEAGAVDSDTFIKSFFKSKADVQGFADLLEAHDAEGEFWVNGRFYTALEKALNTYEGNLRNFDAIADTFREAADDAFKD